MEIKAPAKINLFLNVGQTREDTFHDIISILVKINLYDKLRVEESDDIIVEGPEWLKQEENIVYKAAQMMQKAVKTDRGCRIILEKNIPSGGGLGGGSSDCAAVIKALNKLWGLDLDIGEMEKIGARLGSDVNFFLYSGACLVRGRGEIVEPLEAEETSSSTLLLIDPCVKIATKNVYSRYQAGRLVPEDILAKVLRNYRRGRWGEILRNDLETTVFKEYPVLKDLKNRLINWGTKPLLSGSGSCMFTLIDEEKTAKSVSSVIEENFGFGTWTVQTVK
ncbi:MAG: 4-(cytidine 5'-diphospho)-2-C-methyl-D-erythritol kinase [Elusimicrobia bacterium]|nr:4-(cytidine 5'-diphospho)-2-C-methyl-D-erythritol kinase [Elusimicrobiota bacterium]